MNFNRLRYILTVAEEHNITKAAAKLYISQPSLSQCIRSIENELGTELFIRGKSSVSLTKAGELYVDWAKGTIESYRMLEAQLENLKTSAHRELEVGASPQRGAFLLPNPVNRFYLREPNCNVNIREGLNVNLQNSLYKDELDMIISLPIRDNSRFKSIPLFKEKFLLAAPADLCIPSVKDEKYNLVEKDVFLGKSIIVLQENQILGKIFRDLLEELGYAPQKYTECYNMETAQNLVSNGVGVTLVPEVSICCHKVSGVEYYSINDSSLSRTVAAVYKANSKKSGDIELLASCIKEFLREFDYPFEML